MKIKILHISDLHYGVGAGKDLSIVIDAFLNDIKNLFEKGLKPNIIIFTGDLVQAGNNYINFENARKNFIEPLLKVTSLTANEIFFTPGNHDVNRDDIDQVIERGLADTLISTEEVNKILDKPKERYFERLANYYIFRDQIGNKFLKNKNLIYSTYIFQVQKETLGIASLNSAWRANGGGDNVDRNTLLVGERQIDEAYKDIKECTIKIAIMHHPVENLLEFDKISAKQRIYSQYDLLLVGHNHSADIADIADIATTRDNIFVSNSGCLYQGRNYFNGYSLISIDNDDVDFYLREWDGRTRQFGQSSLIETEFKSFKLTQKKLSPTNIGKITSFIDRLSQKANKHLLTTVIETSAPKTINEIFVKPILSIKSEGEFNVGGEENKKKDLIELDTLIKDKKNYVVIGYKESGKTTLLEYIAVNANKHTDKIPIYINYEEMQSWNFKSLCQQQLTELSDKSYSIQDFEKMAQAGDFLILVDDLLYDQSLSKNLIKKLENINKFFSQYPKNKFILTVEESLPLLESYLPETLINLHFEKIYIHSFSRNLSRQLTYNWFPSNLDTASDIISDRINEVIKDVNLPRTPLIVSIILFIFEKQFEKSQNFTFKPVNKAELLENFIELFLEKRSLKELENSLDYKDKILFLSYLAGKMVQDEKFQYTRLEIEEITMTYFGEKGFTFSTAKLIDYLMSKGILSEDNNFVSFRYNCFCEFFVAKNMINDSKFYSYIVDKSNLGNFVNELDYYSGLTRNDKHLLEVVFNKTEKEFREFEKKYIKEEIGEFDSLLLQPSKINTNKIAEDALEKKPTPQEKDKLLDEHDDKVNPYVTQKIEKEKNRINIMKYLELVSKVYKNSTHIEYVDKLLYFDHVINFWAKYSFYIVKNLEEIIKTQIEKTYESLIAEKIDPIKLKLILEDLSQWIIVVIPSVIPQHLADVLGSNQTEKVYRHFLKDETLPLSLRYLITTMYFNLRLSNYISYIKEFKKKNIKNSTYLKDILFTTLFGTYILNSFPDVEDNEIKKLVADLMLEKKGKMKMKDKVAYKNQIDKKLKDISLTRKERNKRYK